MRLQHESGWRLLALSTDSNQEHLVINLSARKNKREQGSASIGSRLESGWRERAAAGQEQPRTAAGCDAAVAVRKGAKQATLGTESALRVKDGAHIAEAGFAPGHSRGSDKSHVGSISHYEANDTHYNVQSRIASTDSERAGRFVKSEQRGVAAVSGQRSAANSTAGSKAGIASKGLDGRAAPSSGGSWAPLRAAGSAPGRGAGAALPGVHGSAAHQLLGAASLPAPGGNAPAPVHAPPQPQARRAPRPAAARALRAVRVRVPAGTRAYRSFRHSGRNSAKLGAALASLAAAAVLLAALVGSRSGPGPAAAPPPSAAGQPAAADPASTAGSGRAVAVPPAVRLPAAPAASELPPVSVYLTKTGGIETLPLEQYVTGVLAAEMPADFELEALKAQAIAARTFIVRRLAEGDRSGVPVSGADVVDSVGHQAYLSSKELDKWIELGKSDQLAKLRRAVEQTKGIIMTYQGKPITATFFSASGGYTENSEEYWSLKLPYLRSVPSPWDKSVNPSFKETVTIPLSELFNKLGLKDSALPAASPADQAAAPALFQIKSYTAGHNVKTMFINGQSFTGRELRERLGLRSAQFAMTLDGDDVKITTYGNGHGVGMSQWGAQGMAKQGYTTTQILKHYYTGISFAQASEWLEH